MRWGGLFMIMLALLVGGVAFVYGVVGRGLAVPQPIAFNHAVHLGEASLACANCHTDAATHRNAGLPGKSVCLDCHDPDQEAGKHAEKDKLFGFAKGDVDIPWIRVAATRPDVYFSHRRHVGTAKLECLDCHADQPGLTAPPPRVRLVMTMTACIACHERNAVSTDCLVCHH